MHNINRKIAYVEPGSLAEESGIAAGDTLISVNGISPRDILEYRFLCSEYELTLEVEKPDGSVEVITMESDYEDPAHRQRAVLPQQVHLLLHRPAAQGYARDDVFQGR